MLKEFSADLRKGEHEGAWTYVKMDGSAEYLLPVKAGIRKRIGNGAGDTVTVRLDERLN